MQLSVYASSIWTLDIFLGSSFRQHCCLLYNPYQICLDANSIVFLKKLNIFVISFCRSKYSIFPNKKAYFTTTFNKNIVLDQNNHFLYNDFKHKTLIKTRVLF